VKKGGDGTVPQVFMWCGISLQLDAVGRECGLMPCSKDKPANEELLTELLKGLEGQPQTGAESLTLSFGWPSLEPYCVYSHSLLVSSCPLLTCLCSAAVFNCLYE